MAVSSHISRLLIVPLVLLILLHVGVSIAFQAVHSAENTSADDDIWPWFGPRPGRMLKRTSLKDVFAAYNRGQTNGLPLEYWQTNPWALMAMLNAVDERTLRKFRQDSGDGLLQSEDRELDGSPPFSNLMSHRSLLFTPRLGRR